MNNLKKKTLLAAMLTGAVTLTGCSGGGSSSSTTDATDTTTTSSGFVVDGYLGNATICVDLNRNKTCDSDEPRAVTNADGSYQISALQSQLDNFPLLAEIVQGVTTDSDLPGDKLIPKSYKLASPAGKGAVISPLTTMIQASIEQDPTLTPITAELQVKSSLGIADSTVDLFADFVEQKQTDNNYKIIHQAAQSIARTLAAYSEQVKTNVATATESGVQLFIAAQILNELATLYTNAETHFNTHGTVDPTVADSYASAALAANTTVTGVNEATIQQYTDLATSAAAATTKSDIVEAIKSAPSQRVILTSIGELSGAPSIVTTLFKYQNGAVFKYDYETSFTNFAQFTTHDALEQYILSSVGGNEVFGGEVLTLSDGRIYFENEFEKATIESITISSLGGQTFSADHYTALAHGKIATPTNLNDLFANFEPFIEDDQKIRVRFSGQGKVHYGNIGFQNFASLCRDDGSKCWNGGAGEWTSMADVVAVINHMSYDGAQNMYLASAGGLVSTCNIDWAVNATTCVAGSEREIGTITSGLLADGSTYYAVPVDAYNQPDTQYRIYLSANGSRYETDYTVYADGLPKSGGYYTSFEFGAMQPVANKLSQVSGSFTYPHTP